MAKINFPTLTKGDVRQVAKEEITQALTSVSERLDRLETKQDRAAGQLDKLVGMMQDYRGERSVNQLQHDDLRGDIQNLQVLHPGGQHATA